MNITNTILVRSLLSEEIAATYQTAQRCYTELAARLGRKDAQLSQERAWMVCQRVNEIRRKHSPKSIPTVVEILRGQTDRRGPKPAGHHNETGNQMKEDKTVRVSLKRKAADCTGKPYEVTKFVNAVVVKFDDPKNTNFKIAVRVGDFVSEEHATALMDVAEVTVV